TAVVLNKALTLGIGVSLIIWGGLRVSGLILGAIAGALLLVPMLMKVIRDRLPSPGSFDLKLGRQMAAFGLPIALVQLANWMLQLSARFILAAVRREADVGLYSAAYGIAEQSIE